jgi:Sec1 family
LYTALTRAVDVLQSQIFDTLPKGHWFAFIVDTTCLRVVSSHLKLPDLLDYNISVVEPLEKGRKGGPDGVYFVSPTRDSVQRICDDFAGKAKYNKCGPACARSPPGLLPYPSDACSLLRNYRSREQRSACMHL